VIARLLAQPAVYRMWQAPFAEQKLAPVFAGNDMSRVRRVLDVGCGPGTNTVHFLHVDYYLGIDINRDYVQYAHKRYGLDFRVADVTTDTAISDVRFDFILVNSLLHHLDTRAVRRLLRALSGLLADDGHVHILELVRPPHAGVARMLATLDRGDFARSLDEWTALFRESFDPLTTEPFPLRALGVVLWNMIYVKGRARSVA
jgi:SAM-dependent methyltransferase